MATWIMHRLTMECRTLFRRTLTARRHRTTIALAIVETVIDVPVEMRRPAIEGTCANEDAAREPLRPVIAIRGAVIRRRLVVSVRTNRGADASNAYRNMRRAAPSHQYTETDRHNSQARHLHSLPSLVRWPGY